MIDRDIEAKYDNINFQTAISNDDIVNFEFEIV